MKRLLFAFLIILLSYSANAQSSLGVHGGWNNAKIDIANHKVKSHNGYMFGVYVRLGRRLYIQPELNYAHRQSKFSSTTSSSVCNEELEYNSFEVPVKLGFKIISTELFNLRMFAGPEFTYATKDIDAFLDGIKNTSKKNILWNYRCGLGVDIWKVSLDVDYQGSMNDYDNPFKKDTSFNVTLGFKVF